ncbi:hypothetical protein Tco_0641458 [Tanacetum coccineum]
MPTKMELTLEQTQQGVSYEVSVLSDIEDSHGPSDVQPFLTTQAGNPVKKILLKLNLSDHRLSKKVVEVPDSSCLTRSITTCSYSINIMKAQNAQDHNVKIKFKEQAQSKKSMITTTYSQEKVKRTRLKNKDKHSMLS